MTTNTIQKYCLNEIKNVLTDIPLDNMEQMYREKRGKIGRVVRVKQDIHKDGAKSEPEDIPISELYKLAQNPLKSHFHEVLGGASTLYIDYDFTVEKKEAIDRVKLIDEIKFEVGQEFYSTDDQFMMFESSGPLDDGKYKYSYRIIHPDYYFYTPPGMVGRITELNEKLKHLDLSCYKRIQTMRIPYSTKMGQKRVLELLDLKSKDYPTIPIEKITEEQFSKFFIQTEVPGLMDGRLVGEAPAEDDKVAMVTAASVEQDEFVKDVISRARVETKIDLGVVSIRPWLGAVVIELKHYNADCPLCKKAHDSNRNYIILNRQSKTAYLKCHSSAAKGQHIVLLGNELLKSIIANDDHSLAGIFADHYKDDIKIMDDMAYIWDEDKKLWLEKKHVHVQNMVAPLLKKFVDRLIDDHSEAPKTQAALRKCRFRIGNSTCARGILTQLVSMLAGDDDWVKRLNMNPDLIPTRNGTTVDLRQGISRARTREDMFTFELSVCLVEPHLRNPADIKRFFDDAFLGKTEVQEYMKELLGLCLTGHTSRSFFIWIGMRAKNGKSTLIEIMAKILGDFFQPINKYVFVKAKGARNSANEHESFLEPLLNGTRMAAANESSDDDELNGELIKRLSASDIITIRPIYQKPISYQNRACLILPTNHKIALQANDQGVVDRFSPVTFNCRFVEAPDVKRDERKVDEAFVNRMKTDMESLSQTFTFLVEGAVSYFKKGTLKSPEIIKGAKQELVKEQDWFANFLDDCYNIIVGDEVGIQLRDLQSSYDTWRLANPQSPDGRAFQTRMKDSTLKRVKKANGLRYYGLKPRVLEAETQEEKAVDMKTQMFAGYD